MRDLHEWGFPKTGDRLQPLGCSQAVDNELCKRITTTNYEEIQ